MRLIILLALASTGLWAQEDGEVRFGTTVVLPTGLQGRIFHLKKWSKEVPNLAKKKPVGTIYTTQLNIPPQDFRKGFPGVTDRVEWFAIDYTGKFWIEHPGKYRFFLTSDDGSRLYIDDELIINNDGVHAAQIKEGSVELTAGVHRIRVPYFQGPGFEVALVLEVQAPQKPRKIFNTNEFNQPSTVEQITQPAK